MLVGIDFLLGDGLGQAFKDLDPKHLSCVLLDLFLGVRSEGARINGYTQGGNAIVVGGSAGLGVESRGSNHHRRDADILGCDAGTGLLGCAYAASAVARDDGVNAIVYQFLLETLHLRLVHPWAGEQSRRADFVQDIDGGCREGLQDEALEFGMGDAGHERASHQGDGLAVEGFQSLGHLDHLHGRLSHTRPHVEHSGRFLTLTPATGVTGLGIEAQCEQ